MQAPMSRFEQDTFINDRYASMEDRLSVKAWPPSTHLNDPPLPSVSGQTLLCTCAGCAQETEQAYDTG